MPSKRRQWLIVAAAVAVVAAVGVSSIVYAFAHGSPPPVAWQGTYANGQGPMGSMMGGWAYIDKGQLDSIAVSQPVSMVNGTLTYGGGSVKILVLMGPMTEGQSMYSFVIDNITNPTLVFPRGTEVTMVVVNVDTDAYHGLALTGLSPPYAYYFMPMMSSFASTRLMPPHSAGFVAQQISFTVDGNMYYVCPTPGHAQSGMYGQIRVSA